MNRRKNLLLLGLITLLSGPWVHLLLKGENTFYPDAIVGVDNCQKVQPKQIRQYDSPKSSTQEQPSEYDISGSGLSASFFQGYDTSLERNMVLWATQTEVAGYNMETLFDHTDIQDDDSDYDWVGSDYETGEWEDQSATSCLYYGYTGSEYGLTNASSVNEAILTDDMRYPHVGRIFSGAHMGFNVSSFGDIHADQSYTIASRITKVEVEWVVRTNGTESMVVNLEVSAETNNSVASSQYLEIPSTLIKDTDYGPTRTEIPDLLDEVQAGEYIEQVNFDVLAATTFGSQNYFFLDYVKVIYTYQYNFIAVMDYNIQIASQNIKGMLTGLGVGVLFDDSFGTTNISLWDYQASEWDEKILAVDDWDGFSQSFMEPTDYQRYTTHVATDTYLTVRVDIGPINASHNRTDHRYKLNQIWVEWSAETLTPMQYEYYFNYTDTLPRYGTSFSPSLLQTITPMSVGIQKHEQYDLAAIYSPDGTDVTSNPSKSSTSTSLNLTSFHTQWDYIGAMQVVFTASNPLTDFRQQGDQQKAGIEGTFNYSYPTALLPATDRLNSTTAYSATGYAATDLLIHNLTGSSLTYQVNLGSPGSTSGDVSDLVDLAGVGIGDGWDYYLYKSSSGSTEIVGFVAAKISVQTPLSFTPVDGSKIGNAYYNETSKLDNYTVGVTNPGGLPFDAALGLFENVSSDGDDNETLLWGVSNVNIMLSSLQVTSRLISRNSTWEATIQLQNVGGITVTASIDRVWLVPTASAAPIVNYSYSTAAPLGDMIVYPGQTRSIPFSIDLNASCPRTLPLREGSYYIAIQFNETGQSPTTTILDTSPLFVVFNETGLHRLITCAVFEESTKTILSLIYEGTSPYATFHAVLLSTSSHLPVLNPGHVILPHTPFTPQLPGSGVVYSKGSAVVEWSSCRFATYYEVFNSTSTFTGEGDYPGAAPQTVEMPSFTFSSYGDYYLAVRANNTFNGSLMTQVHQYTVKNYYEDADGDGMADGWESEKGLIIGSNDASLDPDGDSLTNLREYQEGTNPHHEDTDGDFMPDGWEISYSLDPTNGGDAVGDPDNDNLNNLNEFGSNTNPNNPDTDGDGIYDGEEVIIGADRFVTNPTKPDTDGDGMSDGWEIANGFDPTNPQDAGTDGDKDGLSNLQEFLAKSDPHDADSDDDGMPDGWEVESGLDANDATDANSDLDLDQLSNLDEYNRGTDPTNNDTDGDGMPDGWEVQYGFNPGVDTDGNNDSDNDGHTNSREYKDGTNPVEFNYFFDGTGLYITVGVIGGGIGLVAVLLRKHRRHSLLI